MEVESPEDLAWVTTQECFKDADKNHDNDHCEGGDRPEGKQGQIARRANARKWEGVEPQRDSNCPGYRTRAALSSR